LIPQRKGADDLAPTDRELHIGHTESAKRSTGLEIRLPDHGKEVPLPARRVEELNDFGQILWPRLLHMNGAVARATPNQWHGAGYPRCDAAILGQPRPTSQKRAGGRRVALRERCEIDTCSTILVKLAEKAKTTGNETDPSVFGVDAKTAEVTDRHHLSGVIPVADRSRPDSHDRACLEVTARDDLNEGAFDLPGSEKARLTPDPEDDLAGKRIPREHLPQGGIVVWAGKLKPIP
jgi:hypothetical protein